LTSFVPYQLGFKLLDNSFEVHLISTENTAPQILARIELSGTKTKSKTIASAQGNVVIRKPDRGRLEFILSQPSLLLQYSSLAQPGGIKVHISSKRLDSKGKAILGATNQKIETLIFGRLPSDQSNIYSLNLSLSQNAYRKNGLLDPDSVKEFCSGMKDLYQSWPELQPSSLCRFCS
jgi:hypothetical protein